MTAATAARARLRHWRRTRHRGAAWAQDPAASTEIAGVVERAGTRLLGWAHGSDRSRPLRIEVREDRVTLGAGTTGLPRPDLFGPHGFAIDCSRPIAAWEVLMGSVQVVALAPDGAAAPLPLTDAATTEALLAVLGAATDQLGDRAPDALLAALHTHPALERRRQASRRTETADRVAARLAALPPRPGPPTASKSSLPPELLPGHVSPDGSVVIGHGGHAFLVEGSNGLLEQYLRPPDDQKLAAWTRLLDRRAAACAALGARFLQVLIPEKSTVLADFLPRLHDVPTPLFRALEGRCLSTLPALTARGLREAAFPRLDTHLTARAAQAVFSAICAAMGFGRPFPDAPFTRTTEAIGDLAERLLPGMSLPETYHWPMPELVALMPEPVLAEEDAPPDPIGHIGHRLVWRTPAAPVDARIIVFGNSFFERGGSPRALSWWFARAFREFHFIWSPELDEAYARTHRPDWVLCQTTERFLPQVPGR